MNEIRVFGPPGCGKTTTLTKWIKEGAKKYGSNNIIIASFTRTAASELVSRDLPISKEQVNTLHAHCYKALGRPELVTKKIKDFNEEYKHFSLSLEQTGNMDEGVVDQIHNTEGDAIFSQYQIYRNKMTPMDRWEPKVKEFGQAWTDFKKQTKTIDYTDMIELAYQNVYVAPGSPTIGFFDEVQDFTQLELSLVRKWGKKMDTLILAGDDDQCIYSFKGATPSAFLTPTIREQNKHILDQSYRVPSEIQKIASKWIKQVKLREPKEYKPKPGALGEVRRVNHGYKSPQWILEDAQQYLNQGKSVMFLTTCSYMLQPLIKYMREQGLTFHNPYRVSRGDWNPIRRGGRGVTAIDRIFSYLRPDNNIFGSEARMWNSKELYQWAEPLQTKGIMKRGAKKDMKERAEDFEFEVTIHELLNYFEEEQVTKMMEIDLNWWESKLLASKKKAIEYPLHVAKKRGVQALNEKPQIIVGTIHSVKGGEADAVYLFPDVSKQSYEHWFKTGEERDAIIRQMYVGLTRCKETLVLCGSSTMFHVNF